MNARTSLLLQVLSVFLLSRVLGALCCDHIFKSTIELQNINVKFVLVLLVGKGVEKAAIYPCYALSQLFTLLSSWVAFESNQLTK